MRLYPRIETIDGRHAIVFMVALGLAAAAGSWWYYAGLQRRALDLWGNQAAELMLRAPEAELLRLAPPDDAPGRRRLVIDGESYRIVERVDVRHAPGFSHVRSSLIHHRSFDPRPDADGRPDWRYVLVFRGEEGTATLAYAPNRARAMLVESGAQASLRPIAGALETFFAENTQGSASRLRGQ